MDFSQVSQTLGAREVRLVEESNSKWPSRIAKWARCPPFGTLYHLPMYVEKRLAEDETIVFPVGTHTETMRLTYADFERLIKPTLAEFARPPQEALP